jgi:hypothetical protein
MVADTGAASGGMAARQCAAERGSVRELEALCRAALRVESPVEGGEAARPRAARRRSSPIESGAGARFLDRTLVPLAEALVADVCAVQAGKGPLPKYAVPLLALHPETLALLALRVIYNRATGRRRPGYAEVAVAIGRACHAEWRVRRRDAKRQAAAAERRRITAAKALRQGKATLAARARGAPPPDDALPDLLKLLAARNRNRNAAARARAQAERFEASDWRDEGAIELGGGCSTWPRAATW